MIIISTIYRQHQATCWVNYQSFPKHFTRERLLKMIELQKSSLVFLQSHRAQVRWVLRYWITACSSRTKKSMSVLGDFRQFFNAYLDRVTVSATGRLLQSSWHCWTATGWGTLMPLPETSWNSLNKRYTGGCCGLTPAGNCLMQLLVHSPLVWWGRELEE